MGKRVAAREVALWALNDITRGWFADEALERALAQADRRGGAAVPREDRALAAELVYGTTRRRNTLDWKISRYSRHPIGNLPSSILNILRMSFYQLVYLDRIPSHAVGHEAVELAKKYGHRGTASLVNGIIRSFVRDPDRSRLPDDQSLAAAALKFSHPEWLMERFVELFGVEDACRFAAANNIAPPTTIRPNRLRVTPRELAEILRKDGVEVETGRYLPEALRISGYPELMSLPAFRQGLFQVQDESSMLVAHVLAPRPGQTIIDVASAPGGKATHAAEVMGDRGRVIACDIDIGRLQRLVENIGRLGLKSVEPCHADARRLGKLLAGQADGLIVDVPCSGLGVLSRRADARWRRSPETMGELPILQAEILDGVADCLISGGTLVYSTCTIQPEENQEVVAAFLEKHSDFEWDDLRPYLPPSLRGETSSRGEWIQLLPHVHGTDGFFISRLRRNQSGSTGL